MTTRQTPRGVRGAHAGGTVTVPRPTDRAMAPIVDLVLELRPDLSEWLAESLVGQALDEAAEEILTEAWARTREIVWPNVKAVVRAAASRQAYAEKRRAEVEAARPRPGDHPGGPVPWEPARKAAAA